MSKESDKTSAKDTKKVKVKTYKTSRKRALYLLYESFVNELDLTQLVIDRQDGLDTYAKLILDTVAKDKPELQKKIDNKSENWSTSRIARIDLSIICIALTEQKLGKIDAKIIEQEAIELAKIYGAKDDSFRFIHAIISS